MASPICISHYNTPQPHTTIIRDGSNAKNAIVIDDNDEDDVQLSNNQTLLPEVIVQKSYVPILDLTGGSATPPASHPPEGVAELPGSEVPAEFASQPTYTLSWGTHAHAQQTEQNPPVATNDELPDTAINSTVIPSQDKTPSLSQGRNSADRPSPQRQNSRPRMKERNVKFRSGSARRGVGNPQLWDDDDITAVAPRSTPASDLQAELYCKSGRVVQCPGQPGSEPHQTPYSEQKVDGVIKYGCTPECGYIVSVAEYKEMVYKNLIRGIVPRGAGMMSDDVVEKEVVTLENGDKHSEGATRVDPPSPASQSIRGDQVELLSNPKSPSEPLEPLVTELAMEIMGVENSDSGSSLPAAVAPTDKPAIEILTTVDESVSPPLVDDPSATKPVSESSQSVVEQTRYDKFKTEDIPGALEPSAEGAPAELPAEVHAPPPAPELQQSSPNPPISPTLLPSPKEKPSQINNPLLEGSLPQDPIDSEKLDAPQRSNSPPPPPTNMPNPKESTPKAMSPPTSTTLADPSFSKTSSRSKASRRMVPSPQPPPPPAPVENTHMPPTTRSSSSKNVCIACKRENGGLSADHPVKCQVCKRAWHRSCNAGLENMGYKVTSWTCRSCSRSRKATRSGTSGGSTAGSTGRRSSRQSLPSSAKRNSDGLYGLGPKQQTKDTVRRPSSNSPSIVLATTTITNAEQGLDKPNTQDAPDEASETQAEPRRLRNRSRSPRRDESVNIMGRVRDMVDKAPPLPTMRTRRSVSYQTRDKSSSRNLEEDGDDNGETSTPRSRRAARLVRVSLEKNPRKEDQDTGRRQPVRASRKRRISPAIEPELEEQDTTLVADLKPSPKRQRVESPPVILDDEILNEEPMVIDDPRQETGDQVVESQTVADVTAVETGEAENEVIEEQGGEPIDVSETAQASAQEVPSSPKIGKFKPLPTLSLQRLNDMICNSGTTLDFPRRQATENFGIPEQPQDPEEDMHIFVSPQIPEILSIAPQADEGANLPADMPCDIRTFEEQEPLPPSIDPEDIDIDAEFEGFSETHKDAEDEVGERYNTRAEGLESRGEECSILENEVATSMTALTDGILQQTEEQQKMAEELSVANERCEEYKKSAQKAKEECEQLKCRIEILEKEVESSRKNNGSTLGLEKQLANARTRYEKAERELSVSKAKTKELERIQRRCEALQNRLDDSKKDYRQLVAETEGQAEKLEAAINEKNALAQNIGSVKSHLDQARRDSDAANSELKTARDSYKVLEREVKILRAHDTRVRLPSLANTGIGGLYSETAKQLEDLKALNLELRQKLNNEAAQGIYHTEQFNKMWKEHADIRKEHDEAKAQNSELKLLNKNLQKRLDNSAIQNFYSKESLTDLWKSINKKDAEIKGLKEEKTKSEEANKKVGDENEKLKQKNRELEGANKELEEANKKLEYTANQEQAELENLKSSNLTHELMKYHYEEQIRNLKEAAEAGNKGLEDKKLVLPNIHQIAWTSKHPSDHVKQQQLDDLVLAPIGNLSGLDKDLTKKESSRIKELEDELERRKALEDGLLERLQAAEQRCRELECRSSTSSLMSSLSGPALESEPEFDFEVSNPMLPQCGTEVDAVGDLPENHRVRTSQPWKERYEAWYNRNPRALHLHRSCKRELTSIKGKVKVLETDGSECKPDDDKADLRGRTRKRGEMTFDEFRGINQNEVVPVSMEKCGKVVFRKAEKNRRTGGLSRHAVMYKTGRNVPGELRG
ncbi:hypothetical protein TWF703_000611 [Orbilia oligospora]|uniref:PHD-type domain-containing protein n=1 Tax=Orbilia oligospora TaxID=2813651 RepID=A0A7C8NS33_ORBOL|nr:hypothetical protein TWF703_000611 [Orbilia oligospora]